MTPLLSCAHLEEMLHLAEAVGRRVREVSDGWSKVSKVISMEPELPDSIRAPQAFRINRTFVLRDYRLSTQPTG